MKDCGRQADASLVAAAEAHAPFCLCQLNLIWYTALASSGKKLLVQPEIIDKDLVGLKRQEIFIHKAVRICKMPHRAASPAISENEFDITKALFKDDITAEDDDFAITSNKDLGTLDAGGILDLGLESDGDGDEAFIKAQQAASNRKASNAKGKSVKKGGGFQAMGL